MHEPDKNTIQSYIKALEEKGASVKEIRRKISSVDRFLNWAHKHSYIEENTFKQMSKEIANFSNSNVKYQMSNPQLKSQMFNKFKNIVTNKVTDIKKLFTRPSINTNNNFSLRHYLGFLILLIFISALGAGVYQRFFLKVEKPFAYPASAVTGARIISFQGRLTDTLGNPITAQTDVVFKLWKHASSTDPGDLLYTGSCAGGNGITPDQDGVFNALVGSDCNMTAIPATVFTENANVWLGITVGSDSEMTPRQQIANVGYAMNAETLQGLPPGTGASNIAFIDASGNLNIGVTSPSINAIGNTSFVISSAKALTFTSASTGDLTANANGTGNVRLQVGGTDVIFGQNSSGNIGIGNTNPTYDLDVVGNARFTNTVVGADATLSNEFVTLSQLQGGTGSLWLDGGNYLYPNSTFATNIGIPSGNLGIGTTSPTVALDVSGYNTTNSQLRVGNIEYQPYALNNSWFGDNIYYNGGFKYRNTGYGTLFYMFNGDFEVRTVTSGTGGAAATPVQHFIVSQSGNVGIGGNQTDGLITGSALTVLNAGNVGIGTIYPLVKLGIVGNSAIGGTYGAFSAPTSGLIVEGNVGIGTTLPSQNLHVEGNMRLTGGFYDGSNAIGTNGQLLSSTGTGTAWINTSAINFWQRNGIILSPLTYGDHITTSGNIGVGSTNTPSNKLDVVGNVFIGPSPITLPQSNMLYIAGNIGIGTTNPLEKLDINGGFRLGNTTNSNSGTLRYTSSNNLEVYNGSAWNVLNTGPATKEITGFYDRVSSTLSFTDGTRTFAITGTNFKTYYQSQEILKNTESIVIANTIGLHYIYYNNGTTLTESTSAWDLGTNVPIATVYWNGTTGLIGEERHGVAMDWITHEYLHKTVGTRYDTGLAGSFTNTTFSIASGYIYDEDIHLSIPTTTTTRVLYRIPAATSFTYTTPQTAYYTNSTGVLDYDNSGTRTAVPINNYVAYWMFATNDPTDPIYTIMGQSVDGTLTNARTNNSYQNLSLANLPFAEMKLLYRLIIRNQAGTATFIEAQDMRNITNLPAGTYIATAHNTLTGLTNDDHTQYALLAGRTLGQTLIGGSDANETLTLQGNATSTGNTATNLGLLFKVGDNGSTTALSILNNGNIGIGTTLPTQNLHIAGNMRLTGGFYDGANAIGTNGQLLSSTGTGTAWINASAINFWQRNGIILSPLTYGDHITTTGNIGIGSTSAPVNALSVSGSVAIGSVPITSLPQSNMLYVSGNVGIGTTAPVGKLQVYVGNSGSTYAAGGAISIESDGNAYINVRTANNTEGGLYFNDPGNGNAGGITYNHSTDILSLRGEGNGTPMIVMNNVGNVGIGTLSPISKLGVLGNATIGSTYGAFSAPTSGLIIEGNVGIGTTLPSQNLHVEGNMRLTGGFYDGANAIGTNGQLLSSTGTGTAWIDRSTINFWQRNGIVLSPLTYGDHITTGGNIGVGSTGVPTYTLDVTGNAKVSGTLNVTGNANISGGVLGNAGLLSSNEFGLSADGDLVLIATDYNSSGDVRVGSEGTITIKYAGNVGIGTTDPTQKLHVSGGLRLTGGFYDGANAIGTNGQLLSSTGTGTAWIDRSTINFWQRLGTILSPLNVGDHITTTGNMGIGSTSTPSQALDISTALGNITFSSTTGPHQILTGGTTNLALMPGGNIGIGTTNPQQKLFIEGNIAASQYCDKVEGVSCTSYLKPAAGGGNFNLYLAGGGTSYFSGNVGIGTTNPGAKLEVTGDIYLSTGTTRNIKVDRPSTYIDGFDLKIAAGNAGPGAGIGVAGGDLYLDAGNNNGVFNNQGNIFLGSVNTAANIGVGNSSPGALLDIGLAGGTLGVIRLEGNTSGYVDIQTAAAAGSWDLTLPPNNGNLGDVLRTDGNGVTTWVAPLSSRTVKNIVGTINPIDALNTILQTNTYRFHYKPGMGTGDSDTEYVGVMADEAPWAMHYGGTIVNPVNTLGYMILGIQGLDEKISTISSQLNNQQLTIDGHQLTLSNQQLAINDLSSNLLLLSNNFSTDALGVGISAPDLTSGKIIDTSTGAYLSSGGVWTNTSDVNLKENFTQLDKADILEKIADLDISQWNYKNENNSTKHIGPTAQNFFSIFGLGDNNKTISTIDPAGVALAGIQALKIKFDDLQFMIQDLQTEINRLNAKIDQLLLTINNQQLTNTISPIIETEKIISKEIQTNEIKAKENDLIINLQPPDPNPSSIDNKGELAKLIIKGMEGRTVATIDASGSAYFAGTLSASDASISGTLIADSGQFNSATISGKLIAKTVEAENINLLASELTNSQNNIASQSSSIEHLTSNLYDVQKLIDDIKNQPLTDTKYYQTIEPQPIATNSPQITNNNEQPTSPAGGLTINNLTITGNSNLYNVSVANSLTVGNLLVSNNSILSLSWDLKLSALSKIDLMDGMVTIAKDGTLTAKGTIIAEKGIKTNEIKSLTDDGQVSINNLTINNLTINNKYLEATSSATIVAASDNFAKNGLYAPAIETKMETAGIGVLPSNNNEIIIYNENVKDNSLIYLTPIDQIQNGQLSVLKKESCEPISTDLTNLADSTVCRPYFKISTGNGNHSDIKFNWLIIN